MSNRLVISSARVVGFVMKIFCWVFSEHVIALKETMVIENVDTLKRSGYILLNQTPKQ